MELDTKQIDCIEKAVEKAVDTKMTVFHEENKESIRGLADGLQKVSDSQERMNKAIAPWLETASTLQSGRKFLLWVAAPIGVVGMIVLYGKAVLIAIITYIWIK